MKAENDVLYEVRDVSKSYGSVVALDGVSLSIRAGEVVGLVGDNGAGKSTLVKVLSGVHQPDSGDIILEGSTASGSRPMMRSRPVSRRSIRTRVSPRI